jgi:hypothetical protein
MRADEMNDDVLPERYCIQSRGHAVGGERTVISRWRRRNILSVRMLGCLARIVRMSCARENTRFGAPVACRTYGHLHNAPSVQTGLGLCRWKEDEGGVIELE